MQDGSAGKEVTLPDEAKRWPFLADLMVSSSVSSMGYRRCLLEACIVSHSIDTGF